MRLERGNLLLPGRFRFRLFIFFLSGFSQAFFSLSTNLVTLFGVHILCELLFICSCDDQRVDDVMKGIFGMRIWWVRCGGLEYII